MQIAYDLHIHSALSPCAENDMTPNNIVNMAIIKGLDVIAVTDHNSGANLEAVGKCAEIKGLAFIPGIEVETAEEVHLVCLLPDIGSALLLDRRVAAALPPIDNRPEIFGRQLIMDESDNIVGEAKQMLMTAASLTIDDVCATVRRLGGVVIPAHVNRPSYSILSNLGFIPQENAFKSIEISHDCNMDNLGLANSGLCGFKLIKSSDAHRLGDILERTSFIELEHLSPQAVIDFLK